MATKDKDTKTAFEKIQETRQEIVDEVIKLLESDKKLDWSMGWNGPNDPITPYQGHNTKEPTDLDSHLLQS